MPSIWLGVEGEEMVVPDGVRIEVPTSITKNMRKSEMSDGSCNYGFFKQERRCSLTWIPQVIAGIQKLRALANLNQVLRYKNEYEDDSWYDVVILSFSYVPVDVNGVEMYVATIDIEGTV